MTGTSQFAAQDPVQAMMSQTSLKTTLFSSASRYYGIDVENITQDGTAIAYIARRFLPNANRFQVLQQHTVIQGERLDNIAAQYLGDPTLFWRLCDANNAMRPGDLTQTIGAQIAITMPENITGSSL
jgi:hypothetical protein